MTSLVALMAAGTVYIVKGTNSAFNQIPDSAYPQFAYNYDHAVGAPAPTPLTTPYPYYLVPYPASFWPITPPGYIFSPTYDQSVAAGVASLESSRPVSSTETGDVVWGYSQGATVVTQYKRDYNQAYPSNPTAVAPTFVLVANPNRPNGGILERGVAFGTIPILGVTFSGATPTQTAGSTGITTYDVARQYDGVADAPENPLNVVADANAAMGFFYLHGQYPNVTPSGPDVINQGTYGDTQYYMIATYPLPLLMPLESIPVIGFPLADTLDPPLRVIVESAYDRTTSPGVPTPFNPLYFPNPVTFGTNLLTAIPTGLDNGISDFTGTRPFGTVRPGPFGVGGPPTPVLSTPTPGTTPTIPVLFGSPGGGFLALLNPTTLLADITSFSQLTGILNAGLPVSIPSLLNPMSALADLAPATGQSPTGPSHVVPAVVSSPNDPSASSTTTPATQIVTAHKVQDSEGTDSDQGTAPRNDAHNDVVPVSAPDTSPQVQPSTDKDSSDTKSGPKLNVSRPSPWWTPGSESGTSSTTGSQPAVTNPIGTAISGVASSIKSALGGLTKAASAGK
ncbi:MAG: PE-PPE domain-containing protein [Mycobacteriaceae bacterium]|nr:PE-PPE domain-containing protein [Mycobacteriaceae bacterium]MBV9638794.1 PE-PPE domain-containing protein [Mycobacteriaceae bacterium]